MRQKFKNLCLYLSFETKVMEFCALCLHSKAGLVYTESVSAEMLPDSVTCQKSYGYSWHCSPQAIFFFFFFPLLLSPHWGCVTALELLSLY